MARRPTPEQIEAGRRRIRREGMADAAVLLVARRFHPSATLENLGDLLGLNVIEVQAAVRRFQALARPQGPPPPAAPARPTGRRGEAAGIIAAELRRRQRITSPDGWGISAELAEVAGTGQSNVAAILRTLEEAGQIRREIRGRRTFLVEWTGT